MDPMVTAGIQITVLFVDNVHIDHSDAFRLFLFQISAIHGKFGHITDK